MPEEFSENQSQAAVEPESTSLIRDVPDLLETSTNPPSTLDQKPLIAANAIKAFVLALLSLIIVGGNFFLENHLSKKQPPAQAQFTNIQYTEENDIPANGIIRFSAESKYPNPAMEVKNTETGGYIFNLKNGRIWSNLAISDAKTNFLADNIVIMPNHAAFDLIFADERVQIAVYDGDVVLGFLPKGFETTEAFDPYSKLFINRMLIARGNKVEIPIKKVNEQIRPLLMTKLVKEFKYSAIPKVQREEEWSKDNLAKDIKFIESKKQQVASSLLNRGARAEKGKLNDFVLWSEKNLTFLGGKKQQFVFENLFSYLDDALFYYTRGDDSKASNSLDQYNNYLLGIDPAFTSNKKYMDKLDEYIENLRIFSPVDPQYKVFKTLLDKKLLEGGELYSAINFLWLDVYRGLDSSSLLLAEAGLNNFYSFFDKTLKVQTDPDFYRFYLFYYNQLFDNLFLNYPVFYQDGYFAIKDAIEENLTASYEDGQLKNELKQSFISRKLDFLRKLKKFFFDGELTVAETKEIYSRLFEEIEKLTPKETDSLAVVKLFESQLNDMDDFFGYLSTPEYQKMVYGSTDQERYRAYLKERETIFSYINVQQEIKGDQALEVEIDAVDVANEVQKVFAGNGDVSNLKIGDIKDVKQRYIEVKGVIGGYPFTASFDRDTLFLKDVHVYDQLISERPLKIDKLLQVLQSQFADLADTEKPGVEEEEEVTLESSAQRTARFYVSNKIAEAGFVSDLENVTILDEAKAVYHVEGVKLSDYDDTVITFDINMNKELVKNIFMKVKEKDRSFPEEVPLTELAEKLIKDRDFVLSAEFEVVPESEAKP